jgi:hypothetical protein
MLYDSISYNVVSQDTSGNRRVASLDGKKKKKVKKIR